MTLKSRTQVLQRVGLRHHADVVFEREDLADADAIDRLLVRKNDADCAWLYWRIQNFAVICFVKNFHKWPLQPSLQAALLLHEMILIDRGSSLIMTLA